MQTSRKDVIQNIEYILANNCVSESEKVAKEILNVVERMGLVPQNFEPHTGKVLFLFKEDF